LAASIFHFGEHTVPEAKRYMAERGVSVRLSFLARGLSELSRYLFCHPERSRGVSCSPLGNPSIAPST